MIRDALGIVAGYLRAPPVAEIGTRFPLWDRMARQPLLWVGAADVAQAFRLNASGSETLRAHRGLLWALGRLFPDQWFTASEVASVQTFTDPRADAGRAAAVATLGEAFAGLAISDAHSPRSVGRILKGIEGRVFEVDGHEVKLRAREIDHTNRYQVVSAAA